MNSIGFFRHLKACLKTFLFALATLILLPLQYIVLLFNDHRILYYVPQLWHKCICKIMQINVVTTGEIVRGGQVLYAANHISYLDIPVMGSLLKASFIAKKDVASWPVFGTLAKVQQTAFISRSRSDAVKEKNNLSAMIDDGRSMILFPEGTSTDGRSVLPFKPSPFSAFLESKNPDILVQPVSIVLEKVDNQCPSDQNIRDLYAWHGDMTLSPHLWAFMGSRGATIRLVFHKPIKMKDINDRKLLANDTQIAVAAPFAQISKNSNVRVAA